MYLWKSISKIENNQKNISYKIRKRKTTRVHIELNRKTNFNKTTQLQNNTPKYMKEVKIE